MVDKLKNRLVNHLKQAGAYDVRVASPNVGFEHSIEGRHPLQLWKECRSVVVFAAAMPTKALLTYIGPYSPSDDAKTMRFGGSFDYGHERLAHLFVATITLWGVTFLQENGFGYSLSSSGLPGLVGKPPIQAKLCAYESGLGVYGRSGVIIHPKLGNRMSIGVILTDALLEPDPKLTNFDPCRGCNLCTRVCPGNAYDPQKSYPESWSIEKCLSGKAKTEAKGLKCEACFSCCRAGELSDEDLVLFEEKASYYNWKRKNG
jgi:epoxyqueuosine reductase QueG